MWDGEAMAGPTPTFFANNPITATEAVSKVPEKAQWDLQKIARVFCMPETITLDAAVKIVKKPR